MFSATKRVLRHSPIYSALVIASVALSVGLSTTVVAAFAAVKRPASPFSHPERLYRVRSIGDGQAHNTRTFDRVRRIDPRTTPILGVWLAEVSRTLVSVEGYAEDKAVMRVEPGFFRQFERSPLAGRFPAHGDTASTAALISSELWRHAFASGPVIGRTLMIDGTSAAIIGVAPPGSRDATNADIWIATPVSYFERSEQYSNTEALLLLQKGALRDDLGRALRTLSGALADEYGTGRVPFRFTTSSLRSDPVPVTELLWALLIGVIVISVISVANLTNLALARVARRIPVLAVQKAIGASRLRLLLGVVEESLGLAVVGGAVGMAVLQASLATVRRTLPEDTAAVGTLRLQVDGSVYVIALALALATALAFSVAPAFRGAAADPESAIRASAASTLVVRRSFARVLVALQVSLTVALTSCAMLVVRAAQRAAATDLGFTAAGLVSIDVSVPDSSLPRVVDAIDAWESRNEGVESVAWSSAPARGGLAILGTRRNGELGLLYNPDAKVVSWNFLRTLRIPIVEGRDLDPGDAAGSPAVVIDEQVAKEIWPNESPIGQQLALKSGREPTWARVVGVARQARLHPNAFDAFAVIPPAVYFSSGASIAFRTLMVRVDTTRLREAIPAVYARLRAEMPANARVFFSSPSVRVARTEKAMDFVASLFVAFAVIAVFLSALGLYATLEHGVAASSRERAIRSALGAPPVTLFATVVNEATVVVLAGAAGGGFMAIFAGRIVDAFLFDLYRVSVQSLLAADVIILGVAVLAVSGPALKAYRSNARDVAKAQ